MHGIFVFFCITSLYVIQICIHSLLRENVQQKFYNYVHILLNFAFLSLLIILLMDTFWHLLPLLYFCCVCVFSPFKISCCFFRIKRDFPRIVKSICPQEERSEDNIGLVLIISLISSSSRKLHVRILSSPWTSRYKIYSYSVDVMTYDKVLIDLRYGI